MHVDVCIYSKIDPQAMAVPVHPLGEQSGLCRNGQQAEKELTEDTAWARQTTDSSETLEECQTKKLSVKQQKTRLTTQSRG